MPTRAGPRPDLGSEALTRLTADVDDKIATALNRWISREATELGAPYLEAGEVIGAMIMVCLKYTDVTDTLRSQIRHQRAAARERGRG